MHFFRRHDGHLHAEDVSLDSLAAAYGTPLYVYSASTLETSFRRLHACLAPLDVTVCYAVKANAHTALLRRFVRLGAGFDLVSGGELRRVLAAGGAGSVKVFAGVAKTEAEIEAGLDAGVHGFHVESEPELERIDRVAARRGAVAPIAIRVNPDVDAKTHAKITTGTRENKFGIPLSRASAAFEHAARLRHVRIRGMQMHIGSQILKLDPFREAVERAAAFLAREGARFPFEYLSIGGGLGIVYKDTLASGDPAWWAARQPGERPPTPEEYGAALRPLLEPLRLRILLEPGRCLVGNAGVLVTRVEYIKRGEGRTFVIVDAGMNDLVRPAMYDAHHDIVPVAEHADRTVAPVDIVGPVCESGDIFARDRPLPEVRSGELLAVLSAGAYGASMASRYNSRALPAEVLVHGDRHALITPRESFEHMLALERSGDELPA